MEPDTTIASSSPSTTDLWRRAASRTAAVAAAFCVVMLALLIGNSLRGRSADPLQTARIQELQIALNRNPSDAALQGRVRKLDVQIRRNYFRSRTFALNGLYLLLGGIAVYLLAMEAVKQAREKAPLPDQKVGQEAWLSAAMSRRSVAALAVGLGGLLVTLTALSRHDLAAEYARAAEHGAPLSIASTERNGVTPPPAAAFPLAGSTGAGVSTLQPGPGTPLAVSPAPAAAQGPAGPATVAIPLQNIKPTGGAHTASSVAPGPAIVSACPKEWEPNWPVFRGPLGVGLATAKDAPTAWDGAAGSGVRWKTPVPLPGWNSPIVWGDRVFLSGASKTQRAVYCFDAKTGAIAWKAPVAAPAGEMKVSEDTGYAPSTLATNGKALCAVFPNGDLAAFDLAGKPMWTRKLGTPENNYGHAASLAMAAGHLIVQYDQGSAPEDGKSVLYAIDPASGKDVWKVKRPAPSSWSTPIAVRVGAREQIVTAANPWVIAYDAASGAELWKAQVLGGEVAPSPTFAGGYVIVANLGASMVAIRPDGSGDVTKTHVAWTASEGLPDITSPVALGDLIFVVTTDGILTCYDAKTGKKVWDHAFDGLMFKASPIIAGGRLYLVDTKGTTHIAEAGRAYKDVGAAPLGEETCSTPAIVAGSIYLRGKDHLFRIGGKG